MRDVFIRIMDKSGNALTLDVSTPSNGTRVWVGLTKDIGETPVIGSWKTLKQGFLRYNFGKTRVRKSVNGDLTTRDLLILSPDATGIKTFDGRDKFGMQLFEYKDALGVNDRGEGFVIQPWVLSITPGRVRWEKMGAQAYAASLLQEKIR